MTGGDATGLLGRWAGGDKAALDEVMALLYAHMHRIAARQLGGERSLTLQPTSLVNEVYTRLVELNRIDWRDRNHFLAMFARVSRRTLVDAARMRNADKRDGGVLVTMTGVDIAASGSGTSVIEIDQLLEKLEALDETAARVVELRVFGDMSIEEAAEHLGISVATVNRKWRVGKAWLGSELGTG